MILGVNGRTLACHARRKATTIKKTVGITLLQPHVVFPGRGGGTQQSIKERESVCVRAGACLASHTEKRFFCGQRLGNGVAIKQAQGCVCTFTLQHHDEPPRDSCRSTQISPRTAVSLPPSQPRPAFCWSTAEVRTLQMFLNPANK